MGTTYDAVIVGAGFGGMGAAIQLWRLGYDNLLILEREDDLGGTWHVNRYPGLAVDIPSSPTRTRSSPTRTGRGCSRRVRSSSATPSTSPTSTTCAGTCASTPS